MNSHALSVKMQAKVFHVYICSDYQKVRDRSSSKRRFLSRKYMKALDNRTNIVVPNNRYVFEHI